MAAPFTLTLNGTSLLELPATPNSTTPYVLPSSITLRQTGDGSGSEFSFDVIQDVTPSGTTPWYVSIPDNAKVEFLDTDLAGSTGGQVLFRGFVTNVSASLNGSATGTKATVSCADASTLLDRRIVYKPQSSSIAGRSYYSITIGSRTDKLMIQALLTYVNSKADASVKALWDTSITSGITSTCTLPKMTFQVGSFRAALDTILTEAQATDGITRRYYVDNTTQAGGGGRLVYNKAPAAVGAFASAPLEIRTTIEDAGPSVATGTGRRATSGSSSAASTYNARSLTLQDDHDSTRKVIYLVAADTGDKDTDPEPYRRVYNQAGIAFPTRTGSLTSEELVDAPTIGGASRTTKITNYSKAYFASYYKPLRTIRFKVRGAGTKDWNQYGFAAGWAQTGASTYSFIDRWEVGQYVRVVAPELGLTYDGANPELSLYRVEQVTMSFEGNSYVREFDITLERRPRGLLSRYIAGAR